MSLSNLGSQTINWKYKASLKGSNLSKMFNGCIAPGIYLKSGIPVEYGTGIVSSYTGGNIVLAPFEAVFRCVSDNKTVHVGTSESINLYTSLGAIGSSAPYIIMSYTWQDQVLNYIDFSYASSFTLYDVVIGKATFSGSDVTGIDYSQATYPPIYDSVTNTFKIRNYPPIAGSTGHTAYKALYMDTATGQILIGS